MHLDLTGKTALVTGPTQGIGLAIAAALARAGARVAVNGRKPEGVEAAVRSLREQVPFAAACTENAVGCARRRGRPSNPAAILVRQAIKADI